MKRGRAAGSGAQQDRVAPAQSRATSKLKPQPPKRPPPRAKLEAVCRSPPRVTPPRGSPPRELSFYGASSRKRAMELLGQYDPFPNPKPPALPTNRKVSRKEPAAPKVKAPEPVPVPQPEVPSLLRVSIPEDSEIVTRGLPAEAPLVSYSAALQASGLLSNAATILQELIGDDHAEVELEHDADWTKYLEVGEAVIAAGAEERSLCIAVCANRGLWGIGCGGKVQVRERAAKLALSVALAGEATQELAERWPAFVDFSLEGELPADTFTGGLVEKPAPVAKKRQAVVAEEKPAPPWLNIGSVLPRDRPFWIQLPDGEPRPDKLEGISGEEAIVVSADRERKGLFNQADRALAVLVPDADPDDIEYHDDASWEHFPAIGTALKAIADQAECMCVATCISRDVWAVGVGMKSKPRYGAAKAALAVTIAMQVLEEQDALPNEMSEMTSIAEFIDEARSARD